MYFNNSSCLNVLNIGRAIDNAIDAYLIVECLKFRGFEQTVLCTLFVLEGIDAIFIELFARGFLALEQ